MFSDSLFFVFLTSCVISFLVTIVILPWLVNKFLERKIVGIDANKVDKPEIPEMGGISVVVGFLAGIYGHIF